MKSTLLTRVLGTVLLSGFFLASWAQSEWEPADNPLMTRWSEEVTPDNVHSEYPRPMMQRDNWQNLNGLWDFAITDRNRKPETYERKILVPFPVEAALSGIKDTVGAFKRVWYKRTFTADAAEEERVLLHFGAVDWECYVFVNDQYVGMHQGGYDPFSFDITPFLTESGEQTLEVAVWDPTDLGKQPVGKQSTQPRGIWYTAVTGIWQTVWIETVPSSYIERLTITPDVDNQRVKVIVAIAHEMEGQTLELSAMNGSEEVSTSTGPAKQHLFLPMSDPELWTPDNPFLYDLEVVLTNEGGETVDQVSSYFGMRKISLGEAPDGNMRLMLNNEPLFHLGPLDQGWWPDGLYTAPTDDALKYDIEVTKELGFNMLRKHVKVEPQRFYYWCDKLGILVWQDMPSGDRMPDNFPNRTPESIDNFRAEYQAMIDAFYNHPSIVMWVPFNEGWGQFETEAITYWTQSYDPTRLVNNASGWTDKQVGDVHDMHRYPGPAMPDPEPNRAAVLGEFGGQALPVEDHLWITDFTNAPTHFKTSRTREDLYNAYADQLKAVYPLKTQGLAAAVYTQTTDVESEVNGFMTYDRAVIKYDQEALKELHAKLYE